MDSSLAAGVVMGRNCNVGHGVHVLGAEDEKEQYGGSGLEGNSREGAKIGDNVQIGTGSTLYGDVCIYDGVSLGMGCKVGESAQVGTDAVLGMGTKVAAGAVVGKSSQLGQGTTVDSEVKVPMGSVLGAGSKISNQGMPKSSSVGMKMSLLSL